MDRGLRSIQMRQPRENALHYAIAPHAHKGECALRICSPSLAQTIPSLGAALIAGLHFD
jgi:hypothetical protein